MAEQNLKLDLSSLLFASAAGPEGRRDEQSGGHLEAVQ